jgi:hypothetical protein
MLKKKANFQHSKEVKIPKRTEKELNKVNSPKIKKDAVNVSN